MRDDSEDTLTRQLRAAVRDLPADKVAEVLDFAGYLRDRYGQAHPKRGSAERSSARWTRSGRWSSSLASWKPC